MLIFFYQTVLVRVTISVIKHHDQTQVGEEGVHLASFTALSIINGSQGRSSNRAGTLSQELKHRPWRSTAHWLTPHGLLRLLCYKSKTISTGITSLTMGWVLPQ